MTDISPPIPLTGASHTEQAFPRLTQEQIERIASHGRVRRVRAGEILIEAGQAAGINSPEGSPRRWTPPPP